MTMTDLGVECVVGLCMAAAIWWVARRRCRSHTEEPKTRLDSADPAKVMALADDAAAAAHDALLAECDSTSEADDDDSSVHSLDEQPPQPPQHQHEDSPLNKEEDDDEDEDDDDDEAAETDVTEHDDGGDEEVEDEDDEDDNNEDRPLIDEKMMEETMARAMAMAANMGVNMSESFMAMEEFLVLDTPQPAAAIEEERMRMEDPASFVHLDDAGIDDNSDDNDNEHEGEDEEEEENEEEEEEMEKEKSVGGEGEREPSSQGLMSAFWAKCEYKDECNLCHSPFSFLVRRHHCRKCCASVCSGYDALQRAAAMTMTMTMLCPDDVDMERRCSSNSAALEEFGGSVERVCDRCWASVQMAAADDRHQEEDHDADDQQDSDDDGGEDDNEAEKALSS
ncbi:uncharacterized protein ACA1_175990 [Acanthamoeba castellanii str. Neff]|uniref:FYVE-type domain-containing protein n=1 Tax=Acanthamoeba castellanii (strain ATCC 30010 / Neff) TaxID=1257118 RepID=L8HKJ3_ACACF|nr:uncharacterized protein ACA1_175990 [Acanthamoeba castellanii str. Neff]ELR24921.1 hypothetical protein ACA1_175990 [Acanthamoeba castellanii str. Neff]